MTEQERRARKREYERNYAGVASGVRKYDSRMVVPENVEVRAINAPCWQCEARGPCRHRRAA